MYLEYFGFREKPFSITPNPRFIFLSKNHREAFAHLLYGINNHAGFIELTGEVGTGKTTVLRTFLNRLDDDGYRTALIFNPCLSALELLRGINREYGIPCEGLSRAELLEGLNSFLLEQKAAGRIVVLVIDEAQNLDPEVLEQIRLISNLETETVKLIQIVLAGQPELESLLARSELRQLKQRIMVRYHLLPMDFEDTKGYIEHRLEFAGGAVIFARQALKRIYRYAGGVPRLINIASDRALLIGYTDELRQISGPMASQAVREVKGGTRSARFPKRLRLAALLAVFVLAAAWIYIFFASRPERAVARSNAGPAAVSVETLRRGFDGMGEVESASVAFNAVAGLWKVNPAPALRDRNIVNGFETLARQRGLQLATFTGSLEQLLQGNTPAILEFKIPGKKGRYYLALTGRDKDQLLIAPPLAGQGSISSKQLRALWGGRGYLLWNNFYKIRPQSLPGSRGWRVTRLQQLLSMSGFYNDRPSGIFDAATVAALKKYQIARGIEPDGRVGALTLLCLYNGSPEFNMPQLDRIGRGVR